MRFLPNHLRPRREKVFCNEPRVPLDREAKVRITRLADALSQPPVFHLPRATTAHTRHYMPFNEGKNEKTTKVFDTFPRTGLPPAFSSFEEFELVVERGVKANSFADYTYIWWDLRPHPRLGTRPVKRGGAAK